MGVEVVRIAADADDADERLDRGIDAAGPMLDEVADVDEIGPARLLERIDDRRALGIDEILAPRLGQHERLCVVQHLELEAGLGLLVEIFLERPVAELRRADQCLARHGGERELEGVLITLAFGDVVFERLQLQRRMGEDGVGEEVVG